MSLFLIEQIEQLAARVDAQFCVNVIGMGLGGAFRDAKLFANARDRVSLPQQFEHFTLSCCEAVGIRDAIASSS